VVDDLTGHRLGESVGFLSHENSKANQKRGNNSTNLFRSSDLRVTMIFPEDMSPARFHCAMVLCIITVHINDFDETSNVDTAVVSKYTKQ